MHQYQPTGAKDSQQLIFGIKDSPCSEETIAVAEEK